MRTAKIFAVLAAIALTASAVPAVRAQDAEFERTLSVTGPVELNVASRSGSIKITTGSSDAVHIRAEITRNRGWSGMKASAADVQAVVDNPPIVQSGNSITIEKIEEDMRLSVSYEITVPATTSVQARTGSGSSHVSGVDGPVEGKTGSGSIQVAGVSSGAQLTTGSGSIKANGVGTNFTAVSGSGSIDATLIDATPVELSTGSGSIKVSGINGPLVAETGSGSVKLQGAPKGDWDVRTGSGSIRVNVAENSNFDLSAKVGSGGISSDLPITIQGKLTRGRLEGKVGGGGPSVTLRTGSGDIRIGTGGASSI